jgi:hypothetical protein
MEKPQGNFLIKLYVIATMTPKNQDSMAKQRQ